MAELKPCPFCNCPDRRVSIRKQGSKGYRIVCGRCGATGPYSSVLKCTPTSREDARRNAIEAWNRRSDNG